MNLTRLRSRITMYSAATAVLLSAFCLLLIMDLITNPEPQFGFTWSIVLVIASSVGAIGFLLLGDRPGPWPALLLAVAHAVPTVLFLTVLESPMSVISVVLQMPVLALYLGGFLSPMLARATEAVLLLSFVFVIVWDPMGVVAGLNDGRSMPSLLIFSWMCLEAGVFVQKRFKRETRIDPLTGLFNRRGLLENADRERARADRNGQPLCVAVVDLDDFKRVNDTEGHGAGDRVLRELALSWKNSARVNDVLCRIGGDEFVFILPSTTLNGANEFLSRLREGAPHPWTCGVVLWNEGEMLSIAIAQADEAMYRRKRDERVRLAGGGSRS